MEISVLSKRSVSFSTASIWWGWVTSTAVVGPISGCNSDAYCICRPAGNRKIIDRARPRLPALRSLAADRFHRTGYPRFRHPVRFARGRRLPRGLRAWRETIFGLA
jgi:hypothetical protein